MGRFVIKGFILLTAILFTTTVFSQIKNSSSAKVADIFFPVTVHDFGQIGDQKDVSYRFTFYNPGRAALIIRDVKPSCHCTKPIWPKQPIMPGDTAAIIAGFSPAGYTDQSFEKTIAVTTNVPENGKDKVIILTIKGSVKKTGQK